MIIFQIITSIGGLFQSSLMGLFFLMGAFFTPKSFDRKSVSTFWKERLIRLGIPLMIYILLINPLLYYIVVALENSQESLLEYYLSPFQSLEQLLDFLTNTGPMWFLWGLLIFTFLYTLWRQMTQFDLLQQYIPKELSIPRYYFLLLTAIILGCATFLIRLVSPIDIFPLGFPFAYFPQYLMMFGVGIIASRYGWFEKMSKDHIKIWARIITVTVILFFLYFTIFLGLDADFSVLSGGFTLPSLIFSLVDNIICMGMIFILIPIAYTKFNTQGPLLQNLSTSSFGMYLIHGPILVAVSLVFISIPLIPILKLAIVFPVTVILCYLTSHYILEKLL
jgi:surface polysaccharide O-acyltransferase-like enzyme